MKKLKPKIKSYLSRTKGLISIVILITIGLLVYLFSPIKLTIKAEDKITKEPIENLEISIGSKVLKTDKEGKIVKWFLGNKEISIAEKENFEKIESFKAGKIPIVFKNVELIPTAKETARRIEELQDNLEIDKAWQYLHPDDQKRWENLDNYKKLFANSKKNETKYEKMEEKVLAKWNHWASGKEYENVTVVAFSYKDENSSFTQYRFLGKFDDAWYYFSTQPKEDEKTKLIEQAKTSKLDLKQIEKNQADNLGGLIFWEGKILEIEESEGETYINAYYIENGEESFDNFIVYYDGTTSAYKGDKIRLAGRFKGMLTYKSQAGWNITVPRIEAYQMEKL